MKERDESRDRPGDRMARITVAEAADRLGISEAGIRKRIQRDQIPHERGEDGRVFVWISPSETRHAKYRDKTDETRDTTTSEAERYVSSLEDQVEYLRGQLEEERESRRRADTILAQLSQANAEQARTIRALEAPAAEPPGAPETSTDAAERGDAPGAQGEPQESPLPWWGKWEIGLLGVLAAIFIVSALLALLVAVLPP